MGLIMQKLLFSFYGIMIFSSLLMLNACEKSETGPNSTDREKILGIWKMTSTGSVGGTINSNINITASVSAPDQVLIENFDGEGSGTYVIASIDGSSIFISQNIIASDTIQGQGAYHADNTLSFTFSVKDGQTTDNRTATARR